MKHGFELFGSVATFPGLPTLSLSPTVFGFKKSCSHIRLLERYEINICII